MISPFNNPHRALYDMMSLGQLPADLTNDYAAVDSLSPEEARMLGQLRRAHPENRFTMIMLWNRQCELPKDRAALLAQLIDGDA